MIFVPALTTGSKSRLVLGHLSFKRNNELESQLSLTMRLLFLMFATVVCVLFL